MDYTRFGELNREIIVWCFLSTETECEVEVVSWIHSQRSGFCYLLFNLSFWLKFARTS